MADNVAVTIMHLVAVELVSEVLVVSPVGMFAAVWKGTVIAVVGIVAAIYVSVKMLSAVVPGAGSDEDATREPVWPIVTVGGAVVWSIGVIAVGADGRGADLNGDLSVGFGSADEKETTCYCQQTKIFDQAHCLPRLVGVGVLLKRLCGWSQMARFEFFICSRIQILVVIRGWRPDLDWQA